MEFAFGGSTRIGRFNKNWAVQQELGGSTRTWAVQQKDRPKAVFLQR
jgi:hypothetical protein